MEYYWELRSKNAQNIKALMCPLYPHCDVNSRNPHRKRKTFFSMSTTRLAEPIEGLNSSLALAARDLWPKKGRPIAVVKGLRKCLFCRTKQKHCCSYFAFG